MSHSGNVTINNTITYINNANFILRAAGAKALGPITDPSAAEQAVEKALKSALIAAWPKAHAGTTLPSGQTAFGYFGPFNHAKQGVAPPSVIMQINQQFQNWQIPTGNAVAVQIAKTITTNLVASGGQAGEYVGSTPEGPNFNVLWLCFAGTTGAATDDNDSITYVFAAMGQVDIG